MNVSQSFPITRLSFHLKRTFKCLALAAIPGFFLLNGCGTAKITGEQQLDAGSSDKPAVVYVTDFGLVPGQIEDDKGVLSRVPILSRPINEFLYGQKPPTERAHELVELMSTSLVKDIEKAGYRALRFDPVSPTPTNGWLIRGMYTKVEEGNQLRRALIGFGTGKTDVQVVTVINDLSQGPPEPILKIDTTATSGDLPGAGPTLVLGPYGATARFLLAGTDLETNVRRTATKIKDALVKELSQVQ